MYCYVTCGLVQIVPEEMTRHYSRDAQGMSTSGEASGEFFEKFCLGGIGGIRIIDDRVTSLHFILNSLGLRYRALLTLLDSFHDSRVEAKTTVKCHFKSADYTWTWLGFN